METTYRPYVKLSYVFKIVQVGFLFPLEKEFPFI